MRRFLDYYCIMKSKAKVTMKSEIHMIAVIISISKSPILRTEGLWVIRLDNGYCEQYDIYPVKESNSDYSLKSKFKIRIILFVIISFPHE